MSTYYIGSISCSGQSLYHFGVKGMKWGKHLFGLWDKYVTGSTANKLRNTYQTRMHYDLNGIQRATQTGNANMMRLNQQSMQRNADLFSKYNNSYNNSLAGRAQTFAKRLNSSAAMSRAFSKASKMAANAYSNAASALGNTGRSISQFYNDVMAKAKDAITAGAGIVAKYGKAAIDSIKQIGKNAIDGARAFIDGILERRRKSKINTSSEEKEASTNRNYSAKLSSNGGSSGNESLSSYDETSGLSLNENGESSSGSSRSSSRSLKNEKKKEKERKKLKKVYRSAGKMDLSPEGTPGLSKYLSNLQNLRK